MSLNEGVRQTHRWVSVAFTAGVIVNVIVMRQGEPPAWVGLLAGLPLALLWLSGVYLFVLPYVARRRAS